MRYLTILLTVIIAGKVNAQLVINELMQSNIDCIMDDLNEFPDSWVELYNTNGASVDLAEYSIGEKNDASKAWHLPSKEVPGKGHILIYCDKEESGLHTDFRLDVDKGAKIYLFKGNELVDSVTELPKMPSPNIAYGRKTDGDRAMGYQATPTPGDPNNGVLYTEILGNPTFTPTGRIFSETEKHSYTITLSIPEGSPTGTEIRYTTDGSEPTLKSKLYSAPLNSDTTLILRAKLFCRGYLSPQSTTHSYIVHPRKMTLPVISIVTDERYLFDEKIGIYVDGSYDAEKKNYQYNWRRPINFEYYEEENSENILNQLGETRIAGNVSRSLPLKTFAIYANNRFGKKHFKHEFFPDQRSGLNKYKSLLLRNAGNDFSYLYMRDAVIQRVFSKNTDVDWQAWKPSIIYINGQYKGILNIRERSNENNIYTNYDGLEDINVVENWWTVKKGSSTDLYEFWNFVNEEGHSLSEYNEILDCNEFANVMLANIFFVNNDFPYNNIVMWRPKAEGGRWRFILKDIDFGLGLYDRKPDENIMSRLEEISNDSVSGSSSSTLLFRQLMKNDDFRSIFLKNAEEYIESFLNYSAIITLWQQMHQQINDEYKYHRDLYASSYKRDLEKEFSLAQNWLKKRPYYFLKHLYEYFAPEKLELFELENSIISNQISQNSTYTSISGIRSNEPLKGFNIVRGINGKMKKVICR